MQLQNTCHLKDTYAPLGMLDSRFVLWMVDMYLQNSLSNLQHEVDIFFHKDKLYKNKQPHQHMYLMDIKYN